MPSPDLQLPFLVSNRFIQRMMAGPAAPPYRGRPGIGSTLATLGRMYRKRAILNYLLNGDLKEFFADLYRTVLTFRTLLHVEKRGAPVPDDEVSGSISSPLACAVALGDEPLAAEIDLLMPSEKA